jgi:hypothetical protein
MYWLGIWKTKRYGILQQDYGREGSVTILENSTQYNKGLAVIWAVYMTGPNDKVNFMQLVRAEQGIVRHDNNCNILVHICYCNARITQLTVPRASSVCLLWKKKWHERFHCSKNDVPSLLYHALLLGLAPACNSMWQDISTSTTVHIKDVSTRNYFIVGFSRKMNRVMT